MPVGRHRQVVDVRPRSRDATVVKDTQCVAGQFGEPATETLLAHRADVPGSGALRVIAQSEGEPTEPRILGPYPVPPCTLTPLELATRRITRCPRINISQLVHRLSCGFPDSHWGRLRCWPRCRVNRRIRAMHQTTDRLRRPLVDGLGARRRSTPHTRHMPAYRSLMRFSSAVVAPHARDRNCKRKPRAQIRRISTLDVDKTSNSMDVDADRRRQDSPWLAGTWVALFLSGDYRSGCRPTLHPRHVLPVSGMVGPFDDERTCGSLRT